MADVDRICGRYRISGLPVTSDDGTLLGIVTNRDIRFETDRERRVSEVMTPMPLVTARVGVAPDEALELLRRQQGREAAAHRRRRQAPRPDHGQGRQERGVPAGHQGPGGRLVVGAAIGVGEDAKRRAQALIDAGVDFLIVDPRTATPAVLDMVAQLKANTDIEVDRRQRRHPSGAWTGRSRRGRVKVGVGPGRSAPPAWWPGWEAPITAIYEAAQAARAAGVPVIGDGGLQYSGDIAKALAAGCGHRGRSAARGGRVGGVRRASMCFINGK